MKCCSNCGKELQENTKFCPHCGTKVEEKVEKKEETLEDILSGNCVKSVACICGGRQISRRKRLWK